MTTSSATSFSEASARGRFCSSFNVMMHTERRFIAGETQWRSAPVSHDCTPRRLSRNVHPLPSAQHQQTLFLPRQFGNPYGVIADQAGSFGRGIIAVRQNHDFRRLRVLASATKSLSAVTKTESFSSA